MKVIAGLCLFGIIGSACGGNPQDSTMTALEPAAGEMQQEISPYYRETPSGDYLASQFAQNQRDWKTAEEYLSRVLEHDPENTDLQRRAMILAMGAGETARAIAKARKIIQTDPRNDLALLIVSLDQFSSGHYKNVQTTLVQMAQGSIGELIAPVLIAWAKSADGTLEIEGLKNLAFHNYHAFLIADYLGKKDELPALADKIFADLSLDYYVLDKVTRILVRAGYKDKAVALYKLVAQQPDADHALIDEKIATLKKNAQPGAPISGPPEGAAEALFDMARLMLREGSYESAKIFTRMALFLHGNFDAAKLVLAGLLTNDERYDLAIDYYRSIPMESEIYPEAQRQAAALLEEKGEGDQAIEILEGLYTDYGDVNALITIGDVYRNKEDYAQAVAAYDRAAKAIGTKKIPEKYWGLLYVRGMAYERLGHFDLAERDLKAALAYRPDHPFILNYLGYSWADRGKNLKEALAMLEKAATLEPEDGYIADSLGWALYKMEKYDDSLPHLEKAVSLLPYDPEINNHLGDAYWQAGRKSEAQFQWERASNNSKDDAFKAVLAAKIIHGLGAHGQAPIVEAAAPALGEDGAAAQP